MKKMENFIHPKFSHLEKGIKPIRVCIDTLNNIKSDKEINSLKENSEDIEHTSSSEYYEKYNMLNVESGECVISNINEKNKFSEGYSVCLGMAIIGIDKNTGKNISLLTHQEPIAFLSSDDFKKYLLERTKDIVAQSKSGTVDAIIFGGSVTMNSLDASVSNYEDSIKLISEITSTPLGFSPSVVTGPKIPIGINDIYLDSENRNLYLVMTEQKKDILYEDFNSSEVKGQIEKYKDSENG